MKCDMHVHSFHSGPLISPAYLSRLCRESYSPPDEVWDALKRRGMNLITLTDHDSIGGGEVLRGRPGFFLSEEVTCRMPSGAEAHIGVYDLTERQHIEIQRRRNDLVCLLAYLEEQSLFFSANHAFSGITGKREPDDFAWFASRFPALETLNGHLLAANNRRAAEFARWLRKTRLGGSDAHTVANAGSAYTLVPGARNKAEFFEGLRLRRARAQGRSGNYGKLTRDVFRIMASATRERPYLALFAPFALLAPAFTLMNYLNEIALAHRWRSVAEDYGRLMRQSAHQPFSRVPARLQYGPERSTS